MTELTTQPTTEIKDKGLVARFTGVLFSPRETFAVVARWPRPFTMLLLILGMTALLTGGFMFTAVGQQTFLDGIERSGNAQQLEMMQKIAPYMGYIVIGQLLIVSPLILLAISGIVLAVFTMAGGDAKFKQVFAVVVHSGAVGVLGQLVTVPLSYITRSSQVVTNASVFFPMLDDKSFLYNVINKVDLFTVWSVMVMAIGLGVLYRRRTGPIAVVFFVLYALIALGIAAFQAARS
ncbi:MAG: YIP1 family protein [Bacteroidales bacterium]